MNDIQYAIKWLDEHADKDGSAVRNALRVLLKHLPQSLAAAPQEAAPKDETREEALSAWEESERIRKQWTDRRAAPQGAPREAQAGGRYLDATDARSAAESDVFEAVEAIWPGIVDDICCDPYDQSLEVMFSDKAPADLLASEADMTRILALGFARFWLNFKDSTEQYCGPFYAGRGRSLGTVRRGLQLRRVRRWQISAEVLAAVLRAEGSIDGRP